MIDAMDKAAGLSPADAVYKARRVRPEFVEGAELCRVSVLNPQNDHGLSPALRIALACRMSMLNEDRILTADYQDQLAALHPTSELVSLSQGATDMGGVLEAIAHHVDKITLVPREAVADDIALLSKAGLSNPQIVALSELIAFVNFQTRVATGLRLMRRSA